MLPFIRGWSDVERTTKANVRLGALLAFVAGATNAGGFLAVGQYTSHMTGVVSSLADNLVLGRGDLVLVALASLGAFLAGAMTTAILVNWGLRRQLRGAYGIPLLLEAVALLAFGIFGGAIHGTSPLLLPLTLALCFIMGLQNAVITKISHAEIRTTHVTGLVTDMGIELGKLLYVNPGSHPRPVRANRERLRVHALLVGSFLAGGVAGALGFQHAGFVTAVPLAAAVGLVALRPVLHDVRVRAALGR